MSACFSSTAGSKAGQVRSFLELAARQGLAVLVSEGVWGAKGSCFCVSFANAAAAELLDQPVAAVLAATIGPEDIAGNRFVACGPQEPLEGQVREVCGQLRLGDGRMHRVGWTTVACFVDDRPFTVHLLRRVAPEIDEDAAFLDAESRFRHLLDIAPDGILVFSGKCVAYANDTLAELLGYPLPGQLVQLTVEHLVHEDDRDAFRRMEDCAALPSTKSKTGALRVIRRDKSWLPVEVVAYPTEWDNSPALLLTVRDLSGRWLHQSQLAHDDRLSAVGTMAAGVAHEINNPLAYVLLNLEYLLREIPKLEHHHELTGHLMERLREARHGAARVAAIVGDLRTFSKANPEQSGPVDLQQVLANAIRVARMQLGERGRIIEEYAAIPLAMGNASRLEQVFLNLLINAVQALPSDRSRDNRIRISTGVERPSVGDWVTVEVADTGAGIAPEFVDRVFDPFFTTKPVGIGTGLGLPICHSIVTRMGGSISVKSEVGRGTTFLVSLPIAGAQISQSTVPPAASVVRTTRRAKVLVVDDEPAVVMTLSRLLGEEHDVVVAADGRQALRCLEQQAFDVILCDLLMPVMSGIDLYEELCRRDPVQVERMAFMSGGAFTPRVALFLAQVQNPRIMKPFDLLAVRDLVESIRDQAKRA